MFTPTTTIKEIGWPALPTPKASSMLAIQHQLEQSQWCTPEEIESQQFFQLSILLSYAKRHVPYYQSMLQNVDAPSDKDQLNIDIWRRIPILKREDVQQAGKSLFSTQIPREHGKVMEISTSGSTGRTIKVAGTSITNFFWQAFTLRDHYWHQRRIRGKQATIKLLPKSAGHKQSYNGWGPSTDMVYRTGTSSALSIKSSIDEQIDWLFNEDPDYLLSYPSNIAAIAKELARSGRPLNSLKEVRTLGETVTPHVRDLCRNILGVPLVDMYSCQEAGYLALQCPKHEHYHVQAENVFLEILDAQDQPVEPGKIGRVVITALHNFATPLIRYDTGDYAELGSSCDCGRGLPVLKRIMGRTRNLITYPDGSKAWPVLGSDDYDDVATIKQFQFIQHSLNDLEVKLVCESALTFEQESQLKAIIHKSLRHPFKLEFQYCSEIPRSEGGKFEDFISLL